MTRWTQEQLKEYMVDYMANRRYPGDTLAKEHAQPDLGPESKLQAKIQKWAKDKGFPVFHDRSRKKNVPGWPDITLCLPKGVVLYLELKSARGVLQAEQKQIRQQMIYLKHNYYVVKSYKQFQEIIWNLTHDTDNL